MIEIKSVKNRLFFLFTALIIANYMLFADNLYCAEKISNERNTFIIFKIYSFMPQHIVMEKYSALADYLSALLNKEVKISISSETDEFIKEIGTGKYDFAFINSVNYTKLLNCIHLQQEIHYTSQQRKDFCHMPALCSLQSCIQFHFPRQIVP